MLQRATIMELLKWERKAVRDYTASMHKTDDEYERKVLNHILDEERDHTVELNGLLKRRINVKGQTDIVNLLSLH